MAFTPFPYGFPSPFDTDEEYARYHGDDLQRLDDLQLRVEACRVINALALVPKTETRDRDWLVDRLTKTQAALRRRRRR